jgi:hypothetical protein
MEVGYPALFTPLKQLSESGLWLNGLHAMAYLALLIPSGDRPWRAANDDWKLEQREKGREKSRPGPNTRGGNYTHQLSTTNC